jgi:hypothetical protein
MNFSLHNEIIMNFKKIKLNRFSIEIIMRTSLFFKKKKSNTRIKK